MTNPVLTGSTPPLVNQDAEGLNPQLGPSDSVTISYADEVHTRTGECRTTIWLRATAPLILHFLFVLVITAAITMYIADNDFNLHSRQALTKFTPLQSDITTVISCGVTLLRFLAASWSGSMVWRSTFLLMERGGGISLEQINRLLTWQMYFPPRRKSLQETHIGLLIPIVLLVSLPCQLSGPILTGSITWSSSYQSSGALKIAKTPSGYTGNHGRYSRSIMDGFPLNFSESDAYTLVKPLGAEEAITAWQLSRDDERTMKRVIHTPSVEEIPINSTLDNVTLPYFSIIKLEWIKDPMKELAEEILSTHKVFSEWNPFRSRQNATGIAGVFAMIPETWGVATLPSPYPNVVSESRIIMGIYAQSSSYRSPWNASNPFGPMPPANIGFIHREFNCYIYGHLTYEAGAAECKNCKVSSWRTVQNSTDLTVSPHFTNISSGFVNPGTSIHYTRSK